MKDLCAKQFTPKPSTYLQDYWIREKAPGTLATPRPGKWIIFVPRDVVDVWWDRIRHQVARGRLGPAAKTSTALRNPLATGPDHVIIVYTVDGDDYGDVMRVRHELRRLGVDWKINYKEDVATRRGQYGNQELHRYSG